MAIDKLKTETPRKFDTMRRAAVSMVRRTAFYRWQLGGQQGDRLVIVPQDLRTGDPSFLTEIADGCLGLAGATVNLDGRSPFELSAPGVSWAQELHSFDWLRHLRCRDEEAARELARKWTSDWIRLHRRTSRPPAWEPLVVARRLISWIIHARLLLIDADSRTFESVMRSLNRQLRFLAASHADSSNGVERLMLLTAIIYGGLCIADQEHFVEDYSRKLSNELDTQMLDDGGHISRNPGAAVELILDLLPLKQCFAAREMDMPPAIGAAIRRAVAMIRYMRLGDGVLGRFNGMSDTWPDRVAAVLAYDESYADPLTRAEQSKYLRLQRRQTILLVDGGGAPPLEYSGGAHAGCASFEMSSGVHPIVVNCGAPGPADQDWLGIARSTANHSTLTINDTASAELMRGGTEARLGSPGLSGPPRVESCIETREDGSAVARVFHDGYAERFGTNHERMIRLGPLGDVVEGADRISISRGILGSSRGFSVTYGLHFHFHPRVAVSRAANPATIHLDLPNGEEWQLVVSGQAASLEESVFLADLAGPLQAVKAVVRGKCTDATEVKWRLERRDVNTQDRRRALRRQFEVIEGSGGEETEA